MKKASWGGALFLALTYGTNAVYQGYISKFYQQSDMRGSALAWLLVSFPLVSAVSQPLWGLLADRSKGRAWALRGAMTLSMLLLPLMARQRSFPGLFGMSCAFAACYPAVQPLGESVILSGLRREGLPYGPVRMAGSAAFALSGLLAGRLLGERYGSVPHITAAGLGFALAASFLLPSGAVPSRKRRARFPWRAFRRGQLPALLTLYLLLQLTLGYFYSYYALYFTALPGGTGRLLGLSLFLASVSELPWLLLGDRLFRRHGVGRLLLLSGLSLTARYLLLAWGRSLPVILLSQALQGPGVGLLAFCMAKYVNCALPEPFKARGQTLVSAAGAGAARVAGSLLGGWIGCGAGLRSGFLLMAGVAFFAFSAFYPVFRLPVLNGEQ